MIVGGYSLDLYCDTITGDSKDDRCGREGFFAQKTKRGCFNQAQAKGWTIQGRICICPACTKAAKIKP